MRKFESFFKPVFVGAFQPVSLSGIRLKIKNTHTGMYSLYGGYFNAGIINDNA